jgi:NADH-quinone oxidoreductase subunit C/D
MTVEPPSQSEVPVVPEELKRNVLITGVDTLYNWGRMYSIWPMIFGLACCAIEFIVAGTARYDMARFGAELARASPRQADLMVVSGTVTKKMIPQIVRLYNQLPEPKYVIAMGACATAGGPFKEGYNVVSGIDKYLPVDVYIPGCPPTPQAFLQGLVKLQQKIKNQSVTQVPWYRTGERDEATPVPILGPDIFDPREVTAIKEELNKLRAERAAELTREAAGQAGADEEEAPEPEPAGPPRGKGITKTLKVPAWDITPTDETQALADRINQAIGEGAATPEKETLVVDPAHLVAVGEYLRDTEDLAYDLLSNVTGVDYLGRDLRFEVVYHLYSTSRGGGPVVLKARAPEENPEVPSLVSVWPSVDLQEREVWDLYGVRFPGHPNLKRILLWEGFHGHPLRKDYYEAYYEELAKPFNSRWPGGHHELAESRAPFSKNVVYPTEYPQGEDWDPTEWKPIAEVLAVVDAKDLPRTGLRTEKIVVNMGPQHPSTHGVFRMVVTLDGETVVDLEPVIGYLHRNHEKIGERNGWLMNMPYTDRLDYLNSMGNNLGYALAVEKLLGLEEISERAQYLRVIMAELNRVLSHMMLVGFLLNELGAAFTPLFYAVKERELIIDLFEEASGSRMMCNYMRFGGVAHDVSEGWLDRARYLARERLPRKLDELEQLLSDNEILVSRTKGVGVIPPEVAIAHGITGPMLRAVGVPYDIRRVEPYAIYDRFDFKIPLLYNGDLYDRYLIRILEAREALKILDQALDQIPEGPVQEGRKAWQMRVPAGEAYTRIEHPKGELGFYLVSNGTGNPWRYRVRSPSFVNLTALGEMCKGHKIADTITILGAIDIVLGEVDR